MLFDPKNAQGKFCLKRSEQESLNDRDDLYVNTKEDIDNCRYFYFELYSLEEPEMDEGFQKKKIFNRMMQVLTGDKNYGKETMSLGGKLTA